ncbi:hypothetical protein EB151_07860, partial [archaeon]|nr:hypothetical protein [archaeon]
DPTAPNKTMVVTIFMLMAFILSIGLILLRYLLSNDISSLNEIVKVTHASVGTLGIIPRYRENIPVSQLVVDKRPKSVLTESFRTIRTNLQFLNNKDGAKTIAITSTISSEGKTFVAINLAGIIAFSGKKVIILDLDMRKPKIHKGFGTTNEIGMSTILIGKHTFKECLKRSALDNLDFITAGPVPPNPSELIIINDTKNDIAKKALSQYLPEKLVYRWPRLKDTIKWSIIEGKDKINHPAIYLCEDAKCSLPFTNINDFMNYYLQTRTKVQ